LGVKEGCQKLVPSASAWICDWGVETGKGPEKNQQSQHYPHSTVKVKLRVDKTTAQRDKDARCGTLYLGEQPAQGLLIGQCFTTVLPYPSRLGGNLEMSRFGTQSEKPSKAGASLCFPQEIFGRRSWRHTTLQWSSASWGALARRLAAPRWSFMCRNQTQRRYSVIISYRDDAKSRSSTLKAIMSSCFCAV
jgi:hypothetical protein